MAVRKMLSKRQDFLAKLSKCSVAFMPLESTNIVVQNLRLIHQGTSSETYAFSLSYTVRGSKQSKSFFLRIFRKNFTANGVKEFKLLKVLKENNLPVPVVYYFEPDDLILKRAFMITEKLDGKKAADFLDEEESARVAIDKMAEILYAIHKLDPKLHPEFRTLQEQYIREQQNLLELLFWTKKISINIVKLLPYYQKRFAVAIKRLKVPKSKRFQYSILHNDYEPNHVLITNEHCGVIDWHLAVAGDPAFDVGHAYHELSLLRNDNQFDLGEYFVDCYRRHSGKELPNLQFCKDISALRLASWFKLFPFESRPSSMLIGLMKSVFCIETIIYPLRRELFQKTINRHHSGGLKPVEYWQKYIVEYFETKAT